MMQVGSHFEHRKSLEQVVHAARSIHISGADLGETILERGSLEQQCFNVASLGNALSSKTVGGDSPSLHRNMDSLPGSDMRRGGCLFLQL